MQVWLKLLIGFEGSIMRKFIQENTWLPAGFSILEVIWLLIFLNQPLKPARNRNHHTHLPELYSFNIIQVLAR